MHRSIKLALVGIVSLGAIGFALNGSARADDKPATEKPKHEAATAALAEIHGAGDEKEKITGSVNFTAVEGGVNVVVDVNGLTPGEHGIHIHQDSDLSAPDLKGAGGHWNPGKHKHGGPESTEHHAGDLGNLTADDKGHAHLELTLKGVTIQGKEGVCGHSVIIHAKVDDLKSQPAGESGARIAGGVIRPEKEAK